MKGATRPPKPEKAAAPRETTQRVPRGSLLKLPALLHGAL